MGGKSLNRNSSELRGGRGTSVIKEASNRSGLESPAIGGNSPVGERQFLKGGVSRVLRSTWNSVGISEDHLVRLNTP